jgi:hypothetical protein
MRLVGGAGLSRVWGYFEGKRKSSVGDAALVPQKPITPGGALGVVGTGRLDECRKILGSTLEHEDTVGIPILVLANKQDQEGCVEVVGMLCKGQGGKVRDSRVLPASV